MASFIYENIIGNGISLVIFDYGRNVISELNCQMNFNPQDMAEMDSKEIAKMFSKIEQIPCPEFGGIKWPSFISFRMKGPEKALKDIIDFESRDTDILICTHSKSGTHWIYEIIKMLLTETTELAKDFKQSTMLELIPDLSQLDALPSPRVLDTHVPFQYLPKKHIENRGKIIHIMRNPKDVMVSYYYHAQKDITLDLKIQWNEFFEVWMSGKVPCGSWYDYELGIEQAENDYPGMIYTCSYEEMKKNPVEEIKRLADFLKVEYSDNTIEAIVKATSFDNMKKNKFDFTAALNEGKGFIFRKGEIGDWKNHFTVAQNEQFNADYQEKMKNSRVIWKRRNNHGLPTNLLIMSSSTNI